MPLRDVIGHRRLISLLARAVRRDTLPPSLIFSGPSGIGKLRVATALAQVLNCGDRRSGADGAPDACGTCPACSRIARGVHPDVLIVGPGDTGTIKIEAVRDVIDRAAYRPFEGRRRVVIVDEADTLVVPAQNALLKTLEEPPPASVFLLVTARPDALLPTVRSRCPRLRFWPLAPAEVAAVLAALGRSEAEARTLSAAAGGSVARALEESAGDLLELRAAAARVLAGAAATGDPRRRLESAKDLLGKAGAGLTDRASLAAHLRVMASLIRDVEALAAGADPAVLPDPDARAAAERLPAYGGFRGVEAFAAVDEALAALDRNAGVKIVADWLVTRL